MWISIKSNNWTFFDSLNSYLDLKDIRTTIPGNKLVVITGVSGSGKSTPAFDTIYAEGQRRYAESLSTYARQFLEQMDKPDVDSIEGLSPPISIQHWSTSKNPRSTVGMVTDICDFYEGIESVRHRGADCKTDQGLPWTIEEHRPTG